MFTAIQGWYTVASGLADVVVCVAEEKMSSTQPHAQGAFITIFDSILERPLGPNQVSLFSAHVNGTCRLGTDARTRIESGEPSILRP